MALHERSRAVRIYHSIVAIIILLAGFGLIALGIWLTTTDSQGLNNLDFGDDVSNVIKFFLQVHWLAIIVGGFLVLAGIFSLIALARNCVGYTFRVFYIIDAIIIFAVLLAACVVSSIIVANKGSPEIEDFLHDAWRTTGRLHPNTICSIESSFECRGFYGCPSCDPSATFCAECVTCSSHAGGDGSYYNGCYYHIIDFLNNVFLPIAIVGGIFAGIMFVDIFATCFL